MGQPVSIGRNRSNSTPHFSKRRKNDRTSAPSITHSESMPLDRPGHRRFQSHGVAPRVTYGGDSILTDETDSSASSTEPQTPTEESRQQRRLSISARWNFLRRATTTSMPRSPSLSVPKEPGCIPPSKAAEVAFPFPVQRSAPSLPPPPSTMSQLSLYPMMDDATERGRLEDQGKLLKVLLGSLFLDPPGADVQDLLDIGCGTGRWVMEAAKALPHVRCMGLDCRPASVASNPGLPANCRFGRVASLECIPMPEKTFDYINARFLSLFMRDHGWDRMVQELYRLTRPGGTVALVDSDMVQHRCGAAGDSLNYCFRALATSWGLQMREFRGLEPLLYAAGFTDVVRRIVSVPIGNWDDQVGRLGWSTYIGAINSMMDKCQLQGVDPSLPGRNTLDYIIKTYSSETAELHGYWNIITYTAQRPKDTDDYRDLP